MSITYVIYIEKDIHAEHNRSQSLNQWKTDSLVSDKSSYSSLAGNNRSLYYLDFWNHSATNPCCSGTGLFQPFYYPLSGCTSIGWSIRRWSPEILARIRLLQPGKEFAYGSEDDHAAIRRKVSDRLFGSKILERHRRLYGCCHRIVCLESTLRCCRRKCLPSIVSPFRHRNTNRQHPRQERICRTGFCLAFP